MRFWLALLLPSWFSAQVAKPWPKPAPFPHQLRLPKASLAPKEMMRALVLLDRTRRVALDQAQKDQPGTVVEVIGYDDEAAIKLLSLTLMDQVRKQFNVTDSLDHQALYAFMNQNPSRPGPMVSVPMLAGGKGTRPDDKWLR